MRHHLRNRKYHRLLFGFVAAAGNLHTVHKSLYQNFFGFSKSLCNGGLYLFLHIHLRHTEAGTAQAGFDKTRQAYLPDYIFIGNRLSLTKQQGIGNAHAERLQILVAGKLVIRQCGGKYPTTGIRDVKHIEIPLQASVFSRSAVDSDIGEVEHYLRTVQPEAEVVAVYRSFRSVGELHVPVGPAHLHNI